MMKNLSVFLWAIVILMALPLLCIKFIELRLLLNGFKTSKVITKIMKRGGYHKFINPDIMEDILSSDNIIYINPKQQLNQPNIINDSVDGCYHFYYYGILDNRDIKNQTFYTFKNIFEYKKYFEIYKNWIVKEYRRY